MFRYVTALLNAPFFRLPMFVLSMLAMSGCSDHKKSIDFNMPKFEPKLVVICGVGSLSGGEAIVRWSKSLDRGGQEQPSLPSMEIYLLQENKRIGKFKLHNKDEGIYKIAPEDLRLENERHYSLEILLKANDKSIYSNAMILPPKPSVENLQSSYNPDYPEYALLDYTLVGASGNLGGIFELPIIQGADGENVKMVDLRSYLTATNLVDVNDGKFSSHVRSVDFSRIIWKDHINIGLAEAVNLRIAYFSKDFMQFKQEADELGYLGDNIYQTVKPIFGNIQDIVGIFSLYNELDSSIVLLPKKI